MNVASTERTNVTSGGASNSCARREIGRSARVECDGTPGAKAECFWPQSPFPSYPSAAFLDMRTSFCKRGRFKKHITRVEATPYDVYTNISEGLPLPSI